MKCGVVGCNEDAERIAEGYSWCSDCYLWMLSVEYSGPTKYTADAISVLLTYCSDNAVYDDSMKYFEDLYTTLNRMVRIVAMGGNVEDMAEAFWDRHKIEDVD